MQDHIFAYSADLQNKLQINLSIVLQLMKKPILSICIPTFNRAHLLKSALHALIPQILSLGDTVELIISDNCSEDDTSAVVQEFAKNGIPIRYHRNNRNLGAASNILKLCNELATGEFAWVLGDDDIVRPDGVSRVLRVLNIHPEVDYLFVNVSLKKPQERHAFGRIVNGVDFPDLLPTKGKSLEEWYVEQWDELIDPEIDDVFLGSLMCSVFRLSCWMQHSLELCITDSFFSSLELTYPHSVILAHTMHARKAYYLGYPCIITFSGEQEWQSYLPLIVAVRLQELLDLYRSVGVDKKRVERCRSYLTGSSSKAVAKLLFDLSTPGREYFSLRKFLWQNRNHPKEITELIKFILKERKTSLISKIVRKVKESSVLYNTFQKIRSWRG